MNNQPEPFDLKAVFDVDDYMFIYADDLTDERTDSEIAGLIRQLKLDTPQRILDLACGFGRHANRLAVRGHDVVGVDVMPGFLAMARQQAESMGVEVDYRHGDARQLDFDAEFDRVLMLFTSFGYFEDDENIQVAANMARALKPGGLLAFDVPNRDAIAGEPSSSMVVEKEDGLVINRLSFDIRTGRLHNRRIIVRDGVRKDRPFSIRLYNAQEIEALLGSVGLDMVKLLSAHGQPLSVYSHRLMVIARKPL
jgi:SAM-dependent methyltransferase